MTADRLRQAATRLRDVVAAVIAREYYDGSWSVEARDPWRADSALCIVADGDADRFVIADMDKHLLRYIATMHPPVALVTSKLLEGVALIHEFHEQSVAGCLAAEANGEHCGCEYKDCYECGKDHNCIHRIPPLMDEALALADAVLGEA